jgi:hypothetical protein
LFAPVVAAEGVVTAFTVTTVAALGLLTVMSLPDVRRYLKIRKM